MTRRLLTYLLVVVLVLLPVPEPAHGSPRMLRVMPLGDSITWGLGDPAHDGYRKDLWVRLRAVGLPVDFGGSMRNGSMGDNNHEGHWNYRIDQIAERVDSWLATYRPDVVLLHIGTNDLGQGHDLANAPARLSALIDRILRARPNALVFVATLTQARWTASRGVAPSHWRAYNAAIPAVVANKGPRVQLVPQHIVGGPQSLVDHVHPSPCGYARMSFVWFYYLSRSALNTTGRPWPTGKQPFYEPVNGC